MATHVTEQQPHAARTKPAIIDCDVHNGLATHDALKPYLAAKWHPYYDQGSHVGHRGNGGLVVGARPTPHIYRGDAMPAQGPPGSDFDVLRAQLLEEHNVTKAVLTPLDSTAWTQYGAAGSAFSAALNEWMAAEWLERDARLYGAVTIPVEDPLAAAAEIHRAAALHTHFCAVLLPIQTREGLGHPKYWPVFEAAVEHRFPVIVHVGGFSGTHMATGFPTYFVEQHTGYAQFYGVQVISLVYSGVFDRFPGLAICLEEGGVTWLPSLLWRLDRAWRSLRASTPHLERRPSEIVREHFWMTTQPFDEPHDPRHIPEILEQIGMNDHLMFASDYPHWDFDDPDRVLPAHLIGKELREAIFSRNALNCFAFAE